MFRPVSAWAALVLSAAVTPALAQEEITLTLSHPYPASHFLWEQGAKKMVDAITEATDGRVKFEVYPAGQLGKDQLGILSSGLADIQLIVPAHNAGKLVLSSVSELPGLYASACEATNKFWSVAQEGGALNEAEYVPYDLHILYVGTVGPYSLSTTSRELHTLDDVKGLKVRTAGAAMGNTVTSLGGVPVQVTGGEMYDALSRGTVDGLVYGRMAMPGYDLQNLIHYSVDGVRFGGGSTIMAMSNESWNRLPDDLKPIVAEAGQTAQASFCNWLEEQEAQATGKFVEELGWTITTLSDDQIVLWNEKLIEANATWAAELDASGRPGSQILEAYKAADGGS